MLVFVVVNGGEVFKNKNTQRGGDPSSSSSWRRGVFFELCEMIQALDILLQQKRKFV
jgi:hypothetical protein